MTAPKQHAHLARHVDEHKLHETIRAAEAGTTAKIQVTLGDNFPGSTFDHAIVLFKRLGLDRASAASVAVTPRELSAAEQALRRPGRFWINIVLTLVVLITLVWGIVDPMVMFMLGTVAALIINYPDVRQQRERIDFDDALEVRGEHAVEAVEILLVFHEARAREVVEVLDVTGGDFLFHRLEQRQELLEEPGAGLARGRLAGRRNQGGGAARQLGQQPGQLPGGPAAARKQADDLVGADLPYQVAQHRR